MRMGEGVEWALHCCLALAWLADEAPISTAKLAAAFGLPPTYLNKSLQALVKAGVLSSVPGIRGGFQLARPPSEITVLDVVLAIDGTEYLFRCTEIRQQGIGATQCPHEFMQPCGIATAMRRAELAWRRELANQTLIDLMETAPDTAANRMRSWWYEQQLKK
ncbi:MAG: Rrf2 family transcriptional regulator [Porticoccaceae bacterium]